MATEKRMERNKLKKIKVKIVCCIGDILQGSSLMILMLRSDLRIRGLLVGVGVDPRIVTLKILENLCSPQ